MDGTDESVPWWRRVAQNSLQVVQAADQTLWSFVSDEPSGAGAPAAAALERAPPPAPNLSELLSNLDAVLDRVTDESDTLDADSQHVAPTVNTAGAPPASSPGAAPSGAPARAAGAVSGDDGWGDLDTEDGEGDEWDEWPAESVEVATAQACTPTPIAPCALATRTAAARAPEVVGLARAEAVPASPAAREHGGARDSARSRSGGGGHGAAGGAAGGDHVADRTLAGDGAAATAADRARTLPLYDAHAGTGAARAPDNTASGCGGGAKREPSTASSPFADVRLPGFSLGRIGHAFDGSLLNVGVSALEAVGASALRAITRDEGAARAAGADGRARAASSERMRALGTRFASVGLDDYEPSYLRWYMRRGCAGTMESLEDLRDVSARSLARKSARLPPMQRAAITGTWAAVDAALAPADAGGAQRRRAHALLPEGVGPNIECLVHAALDAMILPGLAELRAELRTSARAGAGSVDARSRAARACCASGLALCAAASLCLLLQLGARCHQSAESEEGDLLAHLSSSAAPRDGGAPNAAQLTGASFPFATGVERALWAAHWTAEWARALLDAARGWADECADALGDGAAELDAFGGAILLIRSQVGALATHVSDAQTLVLPCLKYTALSDLL
ncbi:hypothetical protein KFE25_008048 [Diacronema lutheri]|uniref:Uncharacterized protein n=1 Tax=Diacronema lutheri TaxID=2081491 RepID=A0A8J5XU97_DIALT|nr:hypothetical protein KFE25_008048 [Diacronema lutheri]